MISKNRNQNLSQKQAEKYLSQFLGAKNFICLDGVTDEDITDSHIDGFARFYDDNTILTVPENDFFDLYDNIKESDYQKLTDTKNESGVHYKIREIPLTAKNVIRKHSLLAYPVSFITRYLRLSRPHQLDDKANANVP